MCFVPKTGTYMSFVIMRVVLVAMHEKVGSHHTGPGNIYKHPDPLFKTAFVFLLPSSASPHLVKPPELRSPGPIPQLLCRNIPHLDLLPRFPVPARVVHDHVCAEKERESQAHGAEGGRCGEGGDVFRCWGINQRVEDVEGVVRKGKRR